MFYSAHLIWLSPTKILIASGTAFGDVIVWSFTIGQGHGTIRKHYAFPAHEGSVFGVRISEPLYLSPDEPASRLLASCSDDRSIRIWDVTNLSECSANPNLDQEPGDTGFRTWTEEPDRSAPCTEAKHLATATGHVSRIWSVHFLPQLVCRGRQHDLIKFVSIGEDATCRIWKLTSLSTENTCDSYPYSISLLATAITHSGKNIWSISTLERSLDHLNHLGFVVGGADAGISAYSAKSLANKEPKYLEWSLDGVFHEMTSYLGPNTMTTQGLEGLRSDIVRSYAFLGDGNFIYTTNSGALISSRSSPAHLLNEDKLGWKCIGIFPNLKGYSVTTSLPRLSLAFFAEAGGAIRAYDGTSDVVFPVLQVDRKVTGLFVQEVKMDEGSQQNLVVLTVTFLGSRPPKFISLEYQSTKRSHLSISDIKDIDISMVFQKEITAVHTIFQERSTIHFIGSRNGYITALQIVPIDQPILEQSNCRSDTAILSVLEHTHGKEAVTSMQWIKDGNTRGGWLFSTGRDGHLVVHHFDRTFSKPTLVHRLPVPLGQNLEGLHMDLELRELLVHGFYSTNFILYDVLAAQEIMSTQCGGAHRTWAFDLHRSADTGRITGGTLIWTKASKSNLHSVTESPNRITRSGFHGREVRVCAIASTSLPGSSLGPLIATGAEDTDIRLLSYINCSSSRGVEQDFRCIAIMRKHNTGIQSLKWSGDGSYLFSSGGFEEFFVWKISATPVLSVGVICESVLPVEAGSDLRIPDFAIKELDESDKEGKEFLIALVYSNSTIKTYRYSTSKVDGRRWTLIGQSHYTASCLTLIEFFKFEDLALSLTAATDGHIALWKQYDHSNPMFAPAEDNSDCGRPLKCIRIHQNAIKCVSVTQLSQTVTLILTGADDNSIGITLLKHQRDGGWQSLPMLSSTMIIPRAHAASITTSTIFHLSEDASQTGGQLHLQAVTSGNDQRIKIWHISVDISAPGVEGVAVEKLDNVPTAVADVSSVAVFPVGVHAAGHGSDESLIGARRKILVCGVGMEVWNMTV